MTRKITKITDIVSLRTIQRLQDNLADALGISLVIFDTKGNKITKTSEINKFWKEFIEDNPLIYPQCKKNISKAIEECVKRNETYIFDCYCNTTNFMVPIIINGKIIAIFMCGRVRKTNPDLKLCHEEAERLNADFDDFLEIYLELPLLNDYEISAITKLLKNVANTISLLSISGTQSKQKLEEVSYLNKLLEEEIEVRNMALEKSEKKYRSIVENALDIICTLNPEGVITSMNEIGIKYINLPKEEIMGSHYSRYIDPRDLTALKNAIREIKEGKRDIIESLQYTGAMSGHRFSINGKAIRDSQGNLIETECIIRDISKEEKLRKELEEAKGKYQELFDTVPDGIYACDMDGKFTAINKAGCEILGYTEEELIGSPVKKTYVNPGDREIFVKEIVEKGYYHGFIVHAQHKSGRDFYTETYSNLVKDENGNPVAIEGVFRDVTARIKLSKKLQESEKKFKSIFENNFDAIILIDKEGRILEHNKKATRLLGHTIDSRNIKEILKEQADILIKNASRKGYFSLPLLSFSRYRKTHHVSVGISKLNLDGGTFFQMIFHDVATILHKEKSRIEAPGVKIPETV